MQQNNRGAVEIPLLFVSGVISGSVYVAAALLAFGSDRIHGAVAADQILSVVTRNKNIVTTFADCSYQKQKRGNYTYTDHSMKKRENTGEHQHKEG